MPLQGVLQSRWMRGLNAAFGIFSQPPNSLPRMSNLLLTRRGAIQTTPGSHIISNYTNNPPHPFDPVGAGMWKELFYYNPNANPGRAGYYGLHAQPGPFPKLQGSVGTPTASLVASVPGAPALGTHSYAVTAVDGVGGETLLSPHTATVAAGAGQGVLVSWTAVPQAFGYNVYVINATAGIAAQRVLPVTQPDAFASVSVPPTVIGGAPPTSLQVDGLHTFFSRNVPSVTDTTQTCNLVSIPVTGIGWNYGINLVHVFPADLLPNPGGGGGIRPGGGGGRVPSGGGGGSPAPAPPGGFGTISGGALRVVSPIPQIIQFADKMFFALGNGVTPYQSDGSVAGTGTITNNFQAVLPIWQPGIGYITGDQIAQNVPPPAGPNYLFTAVQGGVSGTPSPPAWTTVLGAQYPDGQVLWKNGGQLSRTPGPQGAAHAEVYAGSLWVANTAPTFDPANPTNGPSAVWMSDANNPDSWNPLNTAQVARDDGTEIMGLKAFSIAEAGIPTTQQLVVFKNFTTYIINGVFGASDFSIQQAETDQGCIAPRSIQFVPGYGLIRLTHLGFSFFDGIRDRLISTDIHPYLFGDINQPDITPVDWAFAWFSKGAQVADPPMYVCACPVLGANSNLLGTLPVSQFTVASAVGNLLNPVPPFFPPGTYYFRISLRGPLWETAVTPEFPPVVVPSTGTTGPAAINVISSQPLPAGYIGWRIYWGANGPGSEDQYQDAGPELSTLGAILKFPGASTTGPPVGLSGTLTRIFCYDLTLKAWTIIDLPFSISVLKQFRIMGQPPVTVSGGAWDDTVRNLFGIAPDWDGTPIQWNLRTTEVYNQGGDVRVYYRRLRIRGQGSGPIQVSATYDGLDDITLPAVFWALGANQFMAEAGMMNWAVNAHATISGQGQVLIDSLDFHAVPKPVGAGVVIS